MPRVEKLSVKEVEYVAFRLARQWLTFNEPIPDFSTRYPNKLESCLETPFQTFDRKSLYSSFAGKTAALFYFIIKDHPFQNGNKRIAMTTLLALLYKNKRWLRVDTKEFYNFAMWVAQSPAEAKDETITATGKFIKNHLVLLK